MAWKKVESYSFGYRHSDKKFWVYYTLENTNTTTQLFVTPTQFTALAQLFTSSQSVNYETTGGYFSTGAHTLA
ncbi:hypothetical protein [Arenimonas oryziterrae]|uniref:Uncharacterized protein n=1 Tax=Arenimonas oryziterrae DSM 21050 = YC6267 TaxID=1121015 RepID=A0A091AUW3_9GAMM|nr:hypothetical protein [Arenimonas oryziterrae]KFN43042.1 hypothetical protein N789_10800 [Arenimonas oryziterrae DSM 21050 = YC6267]